MQIGVEGLAAEESRRVNLTNGGESASKQEEELRTLLEIESL